MDPPEATNAAPPPDGKQRQNTFQEELENLSCRFIVNLPANELASIERIGFQVEQAHWFYLDFLRPLNPLLPAVTLRKFSEKLLQESARVVPLIRLYIGKDPKSLDAAYSQFIQYKTRVPVCGAILLSADWTKVRRKPLLLTQQVLLVKGCGKGSAWTFPKGKINQDEPERDCAVREAMEETGFDVSALLPADSSNFFELTMREQKIRLYVVPGVDVDTQFCATTRNEISRIEWFRIADLPTWKKPRDPAPERGGKFYLVTPFTTRLRQWIATHKKESIPRPTPNPNHISLDALFATPAAATGSPLAVPENPPGPPAPENPVVPPTPVPGLIPMSMSSLLRLANSPAPSPRPARRTTPAASKPARSDSQTALLDLLHAPKPVPAPPSHTAQQRIDGSEALRNLLGLRNAEPERAAAHADVKPTAGPGLASTTVPGATSTPLRPQESPASIQFTTASAPQRPADPGEAHKNLLLASLGRPLNPLPPMVTATVLRKPQSPVSSATVLPQPPAAQLPAPVSAFPPQARLPQRQPRASGVDTPPAARPLVSTPSQQDTLLSTLLGAPPSAAEAPAPIRPPMEGTPRMATAAAHPPARPSALDVLFGAPEPQAVPHSVSPPTEAPNPILSSLPLHPQLHPAARPAQDAQASSNALLATLLHGK
ncbi:5'-(N(7)-methylguanosine 5'-triphospho)-[mRNA] hydrolase [Malassezia sp. CBS 17886]|nr:5'-(N(7)-methylguanosine 5'-triphospho)-[mRNA] hydrolase [Malassezia sp. CBS 17886]